MILKNACKTGTSFGTEDEVSGGELLFAVLLLEQRATAQHEEQLFGSAVHVESLAGRAGRQLEQMDGWMGAGGFEPP